jgi:hypothetical protein
MTDATTILADHVTEHELAFRLGKAVRTVQRWREDRTGPAHKRVGRTILYDLASVRHWLNASEVRPVRPRRTASA